MKNIGFGTHFGNTLTKPKLMRRLFLLFAFSLLLSSCYVEVYDDPYLDCSYNYMEETQLLDRLDYLNYQWDMGLISPADYDYEYGFTEGQLYQLRIDFPECFYY